MLICSQLPGAFAPPGPPTRPLHLTYWGPQRSPDHSPTYHLIPSYATEFGRPFTVHQGHINVLNDLNDFLLGIADHTYVTIRIT